jgi:hypothetical protein
MTERGGAANNAVALPQALCAQLREAGTADIVVGVLCKNVANTVLHVLNTVSEGLHKYFSDYRKMIVVSDGFSSDRTVELAGIFQPYNGIRKVVTEDLVEGGKGAGVRTIFEIAHEVDAKVVIMVDGDLLSIKPEWVYEFASPVLFGRADLVVPYYIRDKYDGVITNNLIYPFTRALYGIDVRQPIAGEYGLSRALYEELRVHPLFPRDFGIDIFIVTAATANRMGMREGLFCLKLHESTTRYLEPEALIIPMFRQVTGTMFELARHYEAFWKARRNGEVASTREFFCKKPIPVEVNLEKLTRYSRQEFATYRNLIKTALPDSLFGNVCESMDATGSFDSRLWARVVYTFAAYYKRCSKKSEKVAALDALKALWLGRFVSYVLETANMTLNEAEEVIQQQARVFEEERGFLVDIF